MTRGLVLDQAVKDRVKAQVAWADRPENWYRPDRDQEPPGDNPAYILTLEVGFRCVYSQTVTKGKRLRHLSISVNSAKYPHQYAAYTIATMFGFTGGRIENEATIAPGDDWMFDLNQDEHCVVMAQVIGDE